MTGCRATQNVHKMRNLPVSKGRQRNRKSATQTPPAELRTRLLLICLEKFAFRQNANYCLSLPIEGRKCEMARFKPLGAKCAKFSSPLLCALSLRLKETRLPFFTTRLGCATGEEHATQLPEETVVFSSIWRSGKLPSLLIRFAQIEIPGHITDSQVV